MVSGIQKKVTVLVTILFFFFLIRYTLPFLLPFLLGAGVAIAAEPMVRFFTVRLRLPRSLSAIPGVGLTFIFFSVIILVVFGIFFKQLQALSGILPDMEGTIRSGINSLSEWMVNLTTQAPASLQEPLRKNVEHFFSNGSALVEKATAYLLHLASAILSRLPNGALAVGTGILSSFMISAKLPSIRSALAARLPREKIQPFLNSLLALRPALSGWILAQLKLSAVTLCFLALGFLLLGIPYGLLWAVLVALLDAFPIFGTGTALIPWSLVSFLQGNTLRAFGLLGVYTVVTLIRTVLEPRLVGRQLGLDPLITLICLYAGFQLWGIWGMILAPMLAVTAVQLTGANT